MPANKTISWATLPLATEGLFQLCGPPGTNYNRYLYTKALEARKLGHRVLWIDNQRSFNAEKLRKDLDDNPEHLQEFFVFSPKTLWDFLTTVDDIELFYSKNKAILFIDNIFEHLVNNPRHQQHLTWIAWILGNLIHLTATTGRAIYMTNELRKSSSYARPFLAYIFPRFFTRVFILEYRNKQSTFTEFTY